jgi:hypothetical protein
MISIQKLYTKSLFTAFCASSFHIETIVLLPIDFMHIATSQPRPFTASLFKNTFLSLLRALPLNTRSVTFTLQPHPDALRRTFRDYPVEPYTFLRYYLARGADDIRAGHTDLFAIKLMAGAPPIVVSPTLFWEIRVSRFNLTLVWALTWAEFAALRL